MIAILLGESVALLELGLALEARQHCPLCDPVTGKGVISYITNSVLFGRRRTRHAAQSTASA